MTNRILLIITLLGFFTAITANAQETIQKNGNTEKIKGTRFIPYPGYSGSPYLTDKFVVGEIEFLDGIKAGNLELRYSTYRDELIYYNAVISAQILIDKISLKGFSFTDDKGETRVFGRQYYIGLLHEERFFEVLSDGKVSLLVYRKVDLETCDTSYNKFGLAFQPSFYYYIYTADKGYSPIKMNRSSLLSKFSKPNQKLVKKMLRKNKVLIEDEHSFISAWNLIKDKEIEIIF